MSNAFHARICTIMTTLAINKNATFNNEKVLHERIEAKVIEPAPLHLVVLEQAVDGLLAADRQTWQARQ